MLQDAGNENPLLDSRFPDVSGKGRGYQLQSYPEGIDGWRTLRKVSVWQTISALEEEFRDRTRRLAQSKKSTIVSPQPLPREEVEGRGDEKGAVGSVVVAAGMEEEEREDSEAMAVVKRVAVTSGNVASGDSTHGGASAIASGAVMSAAAGALAESKVTSLINRVVSDIKGKDVQRSVGPRREEDTGTSVMTASSTRGVSVDTDPDTEKNLGPSTASPSGGGGGILAVLTSSASGSLATDAKSPSPSHAGLSSPSATTSPGGGGSSSPAAKPSVNPLLVARPVRPRQLPKMESLSKKVEDMRRALLDSQSDVRGSFHPVVIVHYI